AYSEGATGVVLSHPVYTMRTVDYQGGGVWESPAETANYPTNSCDPQKMCLLCLRLGPYFVHPRLGGNEEALMIHGSPHLMPASSRWLILESAENGARFR